MKAVALEEAVALALRLPPKERLQLIERVASSVERDMESKAIPKTGAEIAAMLGEMDAIELVEPEIDDPVEWVKTQRRKERERLNTYWEDEQ